MEKDNYLSIKKTGEGVFKDRGSKFLAFAFAAETEVQVKEIQKKLRKQYFDARHHVYAFRFGLESNIYRASDDGEPSNSSGPPVLGQIKSFDLYNVLVIVVRYFGGTKLGIPGLINAYKTAAKLAIENAVIIEKTISKSFVIAFPYELMNDVMRIVSLDNVEIIEREFTDSCKMKLVVPKSNYNYFIEIFKKMHKLVIE